MVFWTQWRPASVVVGLSLMALTSALSMPVRAQSRREASFGMGPPVTQEIVAAAVAAQTPTAQGPFESTWDSIRKNYTVPKSFTQ
jgi:hypothetical protein